MAINFIEDVSVAGSVEATTKVITSEVESASTILLDAAADITIDAGGQDIILSDDGTIFGTLSNSSGFQIRSRVSDADMFLRGVDNGTEFNALRLDMSAEGDAYFNRNIALNGKMVFNNNQELRWQDSSGTERTVLELDSSNNLYLGTSAGGNLYLVNGSSYTTALTIDSSQNSTFAGSLSASISADSDSTYTGIVVSESGLLKYRTKAQIRSDIGAGTGSGDVTASGGADNYVAVFSSATVIEGESNFTWNGSTLAVTGGGSYSGALLCDNLNLGNNTDTTLSRTGAGEVSIESDRIFADNYHPNADVWTTARTITIGNTGKSVNGSANVTWTLSEIGVDGVYLPLAGGTMTGTTSHGDNVKAKYGTGNDLTIYATGTTSILDIPAGDFHIGDYETFSTGSFSFARVSGETGIYQPEEGLFAIRVNGNTNHIFLGSDGTDVVEIDHESMTVTGDIKLESNSEIELDGNGGLLLNASADVTGTEGNGIIIKFHSTGTTAGSIYYKSNLAAAWSLADADNDTATRMLAVALGSNSGTSGMLLQGVFRKASHGFSAGAPLYLSTTAGAFTTSVPTGSNDYARLVGYVLDSNLIYFNPDNTWVQNN